MLWTLQKYIFREMGKSFLLTAIGLIAVLGLGGGVSNMIRLEGVTAIQLLKIVGLFLPLAATLTLPIAALFSATVTYGRLSADNEFVACRSGGINIHLLFLPTLVISLVSAAMSFFFINFVIPGMIMNIDRFVGADLPRLISQQLTTPSRLSLNRDKYRIYADSSSVRTTEPTESIEHPSELNLGGVAFVQMDDGQWTRFGTAETVSIGFGMQNRTATVSADMYDLTLYDAKAGRYFDVDHQSIDPYAFPQSIPVKVKWLDLGALLQYRRQPSLYPVINSDVTKLRGGISCALFYRELARQWRESAAELQEYGEVRLEDEDYQYVIRAPEMRPDPEDGRPLFTGGVTIVERRATGVTRTIHADSAPILVDRSGGKRTVGIYLQADGNVTIEDERATTGVIRRDRERFQPVRMPEEILQRAMAYGNDELLSKSDASMGLGRWIDKKRLELVETVGEVERDITGVLHSRLAFSMSVFVLVILGAALGIVFRGSQVLTAFGISFVPSLFVITMVIMGKQLIDNPATVAVGVAVTWLGILVVAAGDVFILMKVVRR